MINIVSIFFALFCSGYSASLNQDHTHPSSFHQAQPNAIPNVIVDTDVGTDVDDLIALALLMQEHRKNVNVLGVVTTGDSPFRSAMEAKKFLSLHDNTKDIPVYAGEKDRMSPLGRQIPYLPHYGTISHTTEEYETLGKEINNFGYLSYTHIFDQHRDKNIEVLILGPTTTLGVVLQRLPHFRSKISRLIIMGGYYDSEEVKYTSIVQGQLYSLPFSGDYNLCSDPVASLIVLQSGIPTAIVPPNLTLKTYLTPEDLVILEKGGQISNIIVKAINHWTPWQQQWLKSGPQIAAFLHDPLTLLGIWNAPPLLKWEKIKLGFNIENAMTFRTFKYDGHSFPALSGSQKGFEIDVAVDFDKEGFHDYIMKTLLEL